MKFVKTLLLMAGLIGSQAFASGGTGRVTKQQVCANTVGELGQTPGLLKLKKIIKIGSFVSGDQKDFAQIVVDDAGKVTVNAYSIGNDGAKKAANKVWACDLDGTVTLNVTLGSAVIDIKGSSFTLQDVTYAPGPAPEQIATQFPEVK